ncbi:Zinc-binding alcohol dehydrogenase domain-containing protein cipB [Pleurostoma richardsiae]|uniref:Zinc-binding alcohol dehydrogenase domain-containing protein cipB n=1 Tax=Pleurostoma richardsiae TaxID=41990 RepID=A0AA38RYI0_9PEZI|nr:Zinc-binding alcohol dehydrogenase domain-containing protein cipB [Pleurostoma richardsiae]
MSPSNQAAWIPAKKVKPLQVGDAPYTPPGPGEMVVKNGAVAVNPFDWVIQLIGPVLAGYIQYPFILGTDVAGTVVEVGPGMERFRVGQRVLGSAAALAKESNRAAEGGFQLYTVMREYMAAPTPDHVTDEQACVLGLGLGTAAYGLFHQDYLGLDLPQVPPRPTINAQGKPRAVIITGGSSSVGSNAVQLAASAGYEVLSTSSPKNFAYVKSLRATHVFDYNSPTLVQDLLHALEGRELAGAYVIGEGALDACTAVMKRHDPKMTNKRIAVAGSPSSGEGLESFLGTTRRVGSMMGFMLKLALTRLLNGVDAKFIQLTDLVDPQSVVSRLYLDFLPQALEERQFVPAPPPVVVGKGLEKIQEALDIQRKGVSAKKVVVSL